MRDSSLLFAAILAEVVGTVSLKASQGFSRFWPTLIVLAGYALASWLLALTMRTIPMGVAYAVWSAAGVPLVLVAAWLFKGQRIDLAGVVGIGLIVVGVVVLNVFSDVAG